MDSGIIFRRIDLDYDYLVSAHATNVGSTAMATTLTDGANEISTVEHLISAFAGLGIDNAEVEVDASELPIMDGSAPLSSFSFRLPGLLRRARQKNSW